jgi:hypothetical protein
MAIKLTDRPRERPVPAKGLADQAPDIGGLEGGRGQAVAG